MDQVILGVSNLFFTKIKISNLSLFAQIIIINSFIYIISFIFFGLLNFYLIYSDVNFEDKNKELNEISSELAQYLIDDAIKKSIYDTYSSEQNLKEQVDPISSRIIKKIELISSDEENLDPHIAQKIIDSYYQKTASNIRVYNMENSILYDSLNNIYSNIGIKFSDISNKNNQNFFNIYKRYYIDNFIYFWRIYTQKKHQKLLDDDFNELEKVGQIIESKKSKVFYYVDEDNSIIIKQMIPLSKNKIIHGVIIASGNLKEADHTIAKLSFNLFNNMILIILIVILISIFYAKSIVNPIRKLSYITTQYRQNFSLSSVKNSFPKRGDEIGQLSKNLEIMSDELSTRINELERFAADVSHELKNPLTSIRSANDILKKNNKDINIQKKLISIIDKDTFKMNRLITDISNHTRTKAEIEMNRADNTEINIVELLKDMIKNYSINKKNIIFEFKCLEENLIIFSNYEKIAQVVAVLFDNAISFSPNKSFILVVCESIDGECLIRIVDQGIGIKFEYNKKIFDRFYKDRTTDDDKHSGLGLDIARHIVESYGGSIYLENKKVKSYQGACFVIKFPLKDVN